MPINFHIGNMGVASYYPQLVDSVPPAIHGGNIDDRRIGKGATMYYPVQVRCISQLMPYSQSAGKPRTLQQIEKDATMGK